MHFDRATRNRPVHVPAVSTPDLTHQSRVRRIVLLVALYLAQGLPYGFFTQALPVLLREAGYSLKMISALSLLYLPWALKFLWAPYLDHTSTRKRWLLSLQISSVAGALLLTQLDLAQNFAVLLVAAFAFNIIAASQDAVTDGLTVRMLNTRELGLGNAIQVGGYRVGMILGAGLLLWIFAKTNWQIMFACMAGLLALTVLPVFGLVDAARDANVRRPQRLHIGWVARLRLPGTLAFVFLIFCYRFGDAIVSSLLGPFLSDQGLTKETIALMKGTVGSATSLGGAVIGGWFVFRVGRRFALLASGLAQAAVFVLYIVAAMHIGGIELLWTVTILEGVVGTMATVALFTLMMDASDPEHAGTDYTLFASAVVMVGSLGSFLAGAIADSFGYAPTFAIGTALAAGGCALLVRRLDLAPTTPRIAAAWTAR